MHPPSLLRLAPLLLVFALAVPVVADDDEAPAEPKPAEPKPLAIGESVIKVLDAGAEPRIPLRYRVPKGASSRVEMATKLEMDAMPMKMPAIEMVLGMKCKDVDAEGNMTIEMAFEEVGLAAADDDPMAMVMGAAFEPIKNVTMTWTVTPRGETRDMRIDGADGVPEMMRGRLDQNDHMSVELPQEALGLGARWTLRSKEKSDNGIVLDQTATYTVTAIDERGVSFDVKIEQSAEESEIETMMGKAKVVSMTGKGKGSTRIEFDRIAPKSFSLMLETDVEVDSGMGGSQFQGMVISIEMKDAPKTSPAVTPSTEETGVTEEDTTVVPGPRNDPGK